MHPLETYSPLVAMATLYLLVSYVGKRGMCSDRCCVVFLFFPFGCFELNWFLPVSVIE